MRAHGPHAGHLENTLRELLEHGAAVEPCIYLVAHAGHLTYIGRELLGIPPAATSSDVFSLRAPDHLIEAAEVVLVDELQPGDAVGDPEEWGDRVSRAHEALARASASPRLDEQEVALKVERLLEQLSGVRAR